MMPDLGAYAGPVLGSYGVSLTVIVALVVLTLRRAARLKAELHEIESGRRDAD